jgi:hypothetical protein
VINRARQETKHFTGIAGGNSRANVEELKKELEGLAQENLDEATFAEKQSITNKLGIRVYPS